MQEATPWKIVALTLLVGAVLFLAFKWLHPTQRMSEAASAPVLKIAVMSDGRITVDGIPATTDSVRSSLKQLAEQKGVVWYYREAGQGDAPPEAAAVIQSVIDARVPIRLSSRPDYSDAIGLDGR